MLPCYNIMEDINPVLGGGSKGPPFSFLKITFELIGLLVRNIATFHEFIWAPVGNKNFLKYCFIAMATDFLKLCLDQKQNFKKYWFFSTCDSDDIIV